MGDSRTDLGEGSCSCSWVGSLTKKKEFNSAVLEEAQKETAKPQTIPPNGR